MHSEGTFHYGKLHSGCATLILTQLLTLGPAVDLAPAVDPTPEIPEPFKP